MNSIIGYYSTKFGELWDKSLDDLIFDASVGILKELEIEIKQIDAIFVGNMLSGIVDRQLLLSAHISEMLNTNVPIYRLEAACASGGMAFHSACEYLSHNPKNTVIVLGAEKMTDIDSSEITGALASAASYDEQSVGLTFPGVYALIAQSYLNKYNYTEEHLAAISVKNHAHGVLNEKAHFRKHISIDEVMESPYVAYPLKVLDSSPISDGASSLILSNDPEVIKSKKSAQILASEIATDTISVAKRKNLVEIESTKFAGKKAFRTSKIERNNIQIMEVHDCFSIAEILALEDLGFWKKGHGGKLAKEMSTHRESSANLIVNTSGGLKAAGHPVGSTGIKQIGEIYLQLTNQAKNRQIKKANYGLAHNVGGSGGVAVVSIIGV